MNSLRRMWSRFISLFRRHRDENDLCAEIESHLEMQTRDNLKIGMTPEEARRQAMLKFGSVESIKESYRDQRGFTHIEIFARDVRYMLRSLRKEPGFAIIALLSLALGRFYSFFYQHR